MGARRGKNKRETKNESADFNCSNECRQLPDPLMLISPQMGMWGRCVAKCGSSFSFIGPEMNE